MRPAGLAGAALAAMSIPSALLAGCAVPALHGLRVSTELVSPDGGQVSGSVPQGSQVQLQLTVRNISSASVSGVTVRIAVPRGFSYMTTVSIDDEGDSVRSSDVSPRAGQSTLTWGAWSIGPSLPNTPSQVVVTAALRASGSPGSATASPEVFATGLTGEVLAAPISLTVAPAPYVSLTLSSSPTTATAGETVSYHAVVTNTGAGSTPGPGFTTLSISLPSDFDYLSTASLSGDANTSGMTQPTAGTLVPVWAGFDLPGATAAGPGTLEITFEVQILSDVPPGTYAATASVVDDTGSLTQNYTQRSWSALAPVTVTGA